MRRLRLRKKSFIYAAQFITRYAQPYLIAKIQANSNDDHDSFMSRFLPLCFRRRIEHRTRGRCNDAAKQCGRSGIPPAGKPCQCAHQKNAVRQSQNQRPRTASRASQETEENNRDERIGAYLALLSRAAQHFIDALVMVNNAYGKPINAPKGVWFEFEEEIKVDKTRAERDKMYMDTGQLVLTETYYRDILGFEPDHFELRPKASSENPAPAKFSLRLSDALAHNAPDTAEQAITRPKMEAVLGLLESAKTSRI